MKKKRISVILALIIGLALGGCSQSMTSLNRETFSDVPTQMACTSENGILTTGNALSKVSSEAERKEQEENIMKIIVGDKILTAVLVDNIRYRHRLHSEYYYMIAMRRVPTI